MNDTLPAPIAVFPDELDIRDNDNETYTTLSPFRYGPSAIAGHVITVPKDFTTDFASIPKPFWGILPPDGPYGRAAVVHDYLYSTQGMGGELTRLQCDEILLEAMKALGVGWLTRGIIYRAVRIFGAGHFHA